jgi:hypothetical protein
VTVQLTIARDWLLVGSPFPQILTPAEEAMQIIARIAKEHRVRADDILAYVRCPRVHKARIAAIVAVDGAFPRKNIPWLAHIFRRDPTTIRDHLVRAGRR